MIWITAYSKGEPVDETWAALGQKRREEMLVKSLARWSSEAERHGSTSEDFWQYCPEVTKQEMCSGRGEGFIDLLKHFILDSPYTMPSLDFPVLEESRVWTLFDIADGAAEARRPEGVRGSHNSLLVCRHYFLVSFVLHVLASLVCGPLPVKPCTYICTF